MTQIELGTLNKSFRYDDFRAFVTEALEKDSSILGLDEGYLKYAELNEARLHRLDKTLKVDETFATALKDLNKEYIWIVISESWCGDAAQSVPMLNKLASVGDKIEMLIVLRDQNLELMDQFLTNGGRAIPKLIIVEKATNKIVGDWGPRPKGARELVESYKAENGKFDETGAIELQKWYAKNKGFEVQQEVVDLMLSIDK
ncbi:thioredoxin family protein [Myroides injenensis]|uniref:thioredoxin family protein n=1 Tax=Myroides injenensis TaxID=1183151 RepID=UPI000288FC95|nr:thioredoxin family protein [Myroides injenensis]